MQGTSQTTSPDIIEPDIEEEESRLEAYEDMGNDPDTAAQAVRFGFYFSKQYFVDQPEK